MRRYFIMAGAGALLSLAGLYIRQSHRFFYNLTPSIPTGIYRVVNHSDIARICLNEAHRHVAVRHRISMPGTCPDGSAPLLKPIVRGSVRFDARGFAVNGNLLPNTAPLAYDLAGRPLQHIAFGEYPMPETWAISTENPRSFDSRYLGPISNDEIVGFVQPLFARK